MDLLERIERVKRLWKLLMPTCPVPDDPQFARWADRFTDSELGYALGRTAVKLRRGLPSDSVGRYTTGILLNRRKMSDGLHGDAQAQ